MGVKVHGSESVGKFFKIYMNVVREEMIRTLSYLGEQCVAKVRDRSGEDSWYDQTGNLRSSVGYSVFEAGKKKIVSEFPIIKEGSEGADEGRRMIDELARLYTDTYTLLVVAAMNYAEYVESLESKDVLASTELWAESKINEYLKQARRRVEQRISKMVI